MIPARLSTISEDYRAAGALNSLIQVCSFLNEHTFLTKSGDLGVVFRIHGIDYEGRDMVELDAYGRRFERAMRGLSEEFRLYQYLLKHNQPDIPFRRYCDHEVVDRAIQGRIGFLRSKAESLYSLELYFVLLHQAVQPARGESWRRLLGEPRTTLTAWLSGQQHLTVLASELTERERALAVMAESFGVQLQDFVEAELLDKRSAFCFLSRLLNYAPCRSDAMQPDLCTEVTLREVVC
jgi:type IV secretory pathway VirB4 component